LLFINISVMKITLTVTLICFRLILLSQYYQNIYRTDNTVAANAISGIDSIVFSSNNTQMQVVQTNGQVQNHSLDQIDSVRFSSANDFYYCVPPALINPLPTTQTTATINFVPVPWAVQSELRYRVVGTDTWIILVLNGSNVFLENLTPGTAYEFQLRTLCDDVPEEYSGWSWIFGFTTLAEGLVQYHNCICIDHFGVVEQDIGGYDYSTFQIDYFGGNGGQFSFTPTPSEGVEGLTAILIDQPDIPLFTDNFEEGNGTLTFQITGIPQSCGVASFQIEAGNISCTVERTVYCPETAFGTMISDIDGNPYFNVQIGNQVWLTPNLSAVHFNNGDEIPNVSSHWGELTSPAWSYYDNNEGYNGLYGKLYNKHVVHDGRNACPVGYHIPDNDEWTQLREFLGGISCAGLKMMATNFWPITSLQYPDMNQIGFTALPGGFRDDYIYDLTQEGIYFESMGYSASWWSTTIEEYIDDYGISYSHPQEWYMSDGSGALFNFNQSDEPTVGLSIRCLKD
jgi:uncharacterized protein (TIGR02145 family)